MNQASQASISQDGDRIAKLMKLGTLASVSVACSLVVMKAAVWWVSSSVAMLGSLTDSVLDLAASLVTMWAVHIAVRPADDNHRFGHGKAEALAGLFQAGLMGASAIFLIAESIGRFLNPVETVSELAVIYTSLAAVIITLALVSFQSYVIRQTNSIAISGDHLHYKGDIALNIGVIIAAVGTAYNVGWADAVGGLLIGFYIIHGAWDVGRPAVDMLMDKELDETEREKILNIVLESPMAMGVHRIKTRKSGRQTFIQMHVEVDGALSVTEGHMVADEIEATLGEVFANAEILIHIDPRSDKADQLTIREISS